MRTLSIMLFLFILSLPLHARNFALIVGGSDHTKEDDQGPSDSNQFIDGMSKLANGLQKKGWETSVLFDSDYKPSEWNQFDKSLRPNKPGDKSGHFSLENFERHIDEIIKKGAKSGDQVEIRLNIHGGVLGGRHLIDWNDSRGKGFFSILTSVVEDVFTPTKEIAPKIQRLLEKGIRVHLSTGSCYDGQILKDLEPLVNKFPQLLCITTSTMSDRSSYENYDRDFLDQLISTQNPRSVFEIFKESQRGYNQISSLQQWMGKEEKTIPVFEDPDRPILSDEQKSEAFCSLSHLLFTLPLSQEQLAFITNGSVLPLTKDQLHCEKLKEMCTDKYIAKISDKYDEDVAALRKKYDQGYITLSPQIVPNLYIKKRNMYTIETSQLSLGVSSGSGHQYVGVQDLSALYLQDINKLSPDEKKGMNQLDAFISKNKKLKDSVLNFSREITVLKKNNDKLKCNQRVLNDALTKLKQVLMEAIKDNPAAAGCQNFKI